MKFTELSIETSLLKAVEKMGFEEMTPIQEKSIPLALTGRDIIGQAQTGTGKTVAFGIPLIQNIQTDNPAIQALVVAPTRELAVQTKEELTRLGKDKGVSVLSVFGGADIRRQITGLKNKPDVVVGTPGRLLDHIRRKTLRLEDVHTLVLDEADEMLNMGFIDDIKTIISKIQNKRQTLLFSATMPKEVKSIGLQFMDNPETIKVEAQMTATNVEQFFVRASQNEKFDALTRILVVEEPKAAIIFGRTKRRVDEITRGLKRRGFNAEGIHGDHQQKTRTRVLRDFKANKLKFLVATDVAARGLDVSHVTHVFNYDIPQEPESYVHRIGRTGRAGEAGKAFTFVEPREMEYLQDIEKTTKQQLSPYRPPNTNEMMEEQFSTVIDNVGKELKSLNKAEYAKMAEELVKHYSPEELAIVLAKNSIKDPTDVSVDITPERPLPSKKKGGYNRGRGGRGKGKGKGNRGRGGQNRGNKGGQNKKGGNRNFTKRKK